MKRTVKSVEVLKNKLLRRMPEPKYAEIIEGWKNNV
jgi:hypothetical protein